MSFKNNYLREEMVVFIEKMIVKLDEKCNNAIMIEIALT